MSTHLLSKSSYIRGLQCVKSLYLYKHHFDWQDEISDAQTALFAKGTSVGILARSLFPNGVDLSPRFIGGRPDFSLSLTNTIQEMEKGTAVLYEAAFSHEGLLAAIDILVKEKSGWKIYEVKSGGNLSDTYIQDASLQYYALTEAGIRIKDVSVITVNRDYVLKGEIDLHRLFKIDSVLKDAKRSKMQISKNIHRFKNILDEPSPPEIPIGPHCDSPYTCSFKGTCWKEIPDYSIFNISRIGELAWKLFRRGVVKPGDIPEDVPLNDKQWLEVRHFLSKKPHIDKAGIRQFLDTLNFPLLYLDFETIMPVVPIFQKTSPYQVIPFQYSLHIQQKPGAKLVHKSFVGDGKNDPRRGLVEQLLADTAGPGDILMYTSYEKTQLTSLAYSFPEFRKDILERISRLKDISTPFSQRLYYSHKMKGSYSIKSVYPALVPHGESYTDLEINNGGLASQAYESIHFDVDPAHRESIRKNLLAYCRLDTLAMVSIMDVLRDVSSE